MNTPERTLDVITIGRASADLYGDQVGGRLEDMASFSKYVGGCPANISVGSARLGLKSALLTRVGADYMGRYLLEQLGREGVCTDAIVSDPNRLTALAILGIRDKEQFPLLFYREDCADMAICEADIDESFFARSRSVLVTGTHLSKPGVRAASKKAIRLARENGARVIMDVDYRPVLWGLTSPELGEQRFVADENVTRELQTIIEDVDLIVGTEEELHILGGTTDTLEAMREIRKRSQAVIVCKRGELGCSVFDGEIPASLDDGISGRSFEIEVFNVLGAGDAFMSGFLRGWLRGESLQTCCTWGNACGALVVSRHGCAPAIPSWDELQYFLENGSEHRALRHDMALEHVHWATNRNADYDSLKILAIDHRAQFRELAEELGADDASISHLKALAIESVDQVAQGDPSFGILLDGEFGEDALAVMADYPYWLGRPIETAGVMPLQFEGVADVGMEISNWPLTQVVKCLLNYRCSDPEELRREQEQQVLRLFDACRQSRHELLLEIIVSGNGQVEPGETARVMERFLQLGVRPDWWKLEPCADPDEWQEINRVIEAYDPWCRGVVLLGLSAPIDELTRSFAVAGESPWVKGFAVGRSIWYDAARRWLQGERDDQAFVAELASRFSTLVEAWDRAAEQQSDLAVANVKQA